jgi:hypothetical protein
MTSKPEAGRRRKNDRSEIPVSFLPSGNPAARRAYLFTVFGLIPGLGILCGPPAVFFGILGGRAARRDEHGRGKGHSFVSRLVGSIEFLSGLAGLACLARAFELF